MVALDTVPTSRAQQSDTASEVTEPHVCPPPDVSIAKRTPISSFVGPVPALGVIEGEPLTLTSVIVAPSKSPGIDPDIVCVPAAEIFDCALTVIFHVAMSI